MQTLEQIQILVPDPSSDKRVAVFYFLRPSIAVEATAGQALWPDTAVMIVLPIRSGVTQQDHRVDNDQWRLINGPVELLHL